MKNHTIRYGSLDAFYDGIAALVMRGLTFEADADRLEIVLTGGY